MIQNWKFQRGDIFFTRFDNAIGSEQSGNRPAVVLQNDVGNFYSPTLIVATLTSKAAKKYTQPTHCLLVNDFLSVPSIVQAEQIFTVDKSRVLKYLGHLTPEEMRRVDDAVRISLALNPMGSIQQIEPIRRSTSLYAPPEVVDGKPPVYPYTPIRSSFENAGSIEEMMLYTELQSAVHAMIQRLEYSFTFNPSLLTSPKRKQQVSEILEEAEKYIWRIKEEMRCAFQGVCRSHQPGGAVPQLRQYATERLPHQLRGHGAEAVRPAGRRDLLRSPAAHRGGVGGQTGFLPGGCPAGRDVLCAAVPWAVQR